MTIFLTKIKLVSAMLAKSGLGGRFAAAFFLKKIVSDRHQRDMAKIGQI